jgi:hypothetical protein
MNVYEKAGQVQSSGQQVTIAYPKRNERRETTVLIEINSRDRNIVQYPNPSEFRFRLYRPLKDVVKIQIAGGTVPGCLYNLNTGWNQFTFQESARKWNVTIPPGRYTYETLCSKLASVLNTLSGATNTYSVTIDATTGVLTLQRLTGAADFAFLFLTGDYIDFARMRKGQIDVAKAVSQAVKNLNEQRSSIVSGLKEKGSSTRQIAEYLKLKGFKFFLGQPSHFQ